MAGNTRRTSDAFELATAIVFQSSGQNFALTPRNLTEQPQFEIDFMKQVPTTWDETRFIDGYPGKYVVLARRHADQWYIAALNAQKEPLTLSLDIKDYNVKSLITDEADITNTVSLPLKADKKGNVKLAVQSNGGAVLF